MSCGITCRGGAGVAAGNERVAAPGRIGAASVAALTGGAGAVGAARPEPASIGVLSNRMRGSFEGDGNALDRTEEGAAKGSGGGGSGRRGRIASAADANCGADPAPVWSVRIVNAI
jgi:hypothetical protein